MHLSKLQGSLLCLILLEAHLVTQCFLRILLDQGFDFIVREQHELILWAFSFVFAAEQLDCFLQLQ